MKLKHIQNYRIANTKLHCKFSEPIKKCYCTDIKRKLHYKNFCIHKKHNTTKEKKFTYTIFSSGFVNITGIKSFSETKEALIYLCKLTNRNSESENTFKLLQEDKKIIADNITVVGKLIRRIDYDFYLIDKLNKQEKTIYNTNYNLHFPGLFLRINNVIGTTVLFRSGYFTIVGTKCVADIHCMIQNLDVFMDKLFSTNTQQQLFASCVDWY